MEGSARCPVCDAPLDGGTPEGLCPACLLGAGIGGGDHEADERSGPGAIDMIAEKAGDMVGRYHLVEKIGEGGFAVVFRAEQRMPVRWVVAVKVIKPGMDSREVVSRFEAERQALALMDHPNIAKVYDAGVTDWGRPYFVMEHVEGHPLTTFCDEHQLGIRDRLELFVRICRAVQHAHQKGVIHRDLKPGNILVREGEEGVPRPKVIDFGVAKAISIELTGKTFFTVFGGVVGTPLYMSPEQTELNAVDVDTRSDIYTLGVVLYELLTGAPPLGEEELSSASFDQMRRMIREEDSLKPSARVVTMTADERRAAAEARRVDPAKFRRILSGDLDWIVMKALEKDRGRRYGTVHGLAVDVRRFLRHLPVTAGRPGAAYRIGKFVRRHRTSVIATSLALLVMIIALVTGLKMKRDARNRVEYGRLRSLVTEIPNQRKEEPGSRTKAIEKLKSVGKYPLDSIHVTGTQARELLDAARNELIACLAWTDLQERTVSPRVVKNPWSLAAALDGKHERGAMGFEDGRVVVWEVAGGQDCAVRPGGGRPVRGPLSFGPDGKLVAVGFGGAGPDQWELVLWDWETGRDVVSGVQGVGAAFDFHPAGDGFAVGTAAGTVGFFGMDGTARLGSIPLSGSPAAIRFSRPDGRHVAVATKQFGVVILDSETGARGEGWPGVDAVSLAWAPDGRSLVAGGADGSVTVLAPGLREPVFSHTRHIDPVEEVAWSHDGLLIASGSRDGMVRLWDGRQGEFLCQFASWARTLGFSKRDRALGPVLSGDHLVSVLDVKRAPVCHRVAGHPGEEITAAVWVAGGGVLATAAPDGMRLWNRMGAQLDHFPDARVRPGGLAGSGTHLYLAEDGGISRRSVSIAGGRLHCGPPEGLGAIQGGAQILLSPPSTPGDPFLVVAGESEVVVLNLASGALQHLPAPDTPAFLALSPDGDWLAAGSRRGTSVLVWRLGPSVVKAWDLPVAGPATVAFHPKRRAPPLLMTGDAEAYRLWSWDAAATRLTEGPVHLNKMDNPRGRMARMVFSPRGTVAVVSYERKLLQVVHSTSLKLMTQPGFDEQWPLAISPDGRMMATEAAKGRIFIWDLEAIRRELGTCNLDWHALPPFKFPPVPVVMP